MPGRRLLTERGKKLASPCTANSKAWPVWDCVVINLGERTRDYIPIHTKVFSTSSYQAGCKHTCLPTNKPHETDGQHWACKLTLVLTVLGNTVCDHPRSSVFSTPLLQRFPTQICLLCTVYVRLLRCVTVHRITTTSHQSSPLACPYVHCEATRLGNRMARGWQPQCRGLHSLGGPPKSIQVAQFDRISSSVLT